MKAFKKSWDQYGWMILIIGFLYTVFAIVIHLKSSKFLEDTFLGLDMNFWITYGVPGLMFLLLLFVAIARAPYEIYREQFEKNASEILEKSLEIKKVSDEFLAFKDQHRPLEIELLPTVVRLAIGAPPDDRIMIAKNNISDFNVEIYNPNPTQGVIGSNIKIKEIKPALDKAESVAHQRFVSSALGQDFEPHQTYDSTDYLTFDDQKFVVGIVGAQQKHRICLFTAKRFGEYIEIEFKQALFGTCKFCPKAEHIFRIEVNGDGVATTLADFKFSFVHKATPLSDVENITEATKSKEPVFTVEKL